MGLGSRDTKLRGAAYSGAYYIRDREDHSLHSELGTRRSTKSRVFGSPGDYGDFN